MVQRGRRSSGGQHFETIKEGKETLKSLDMDRGSLWLRMPWAPHLCLNWLSGALEQHLTSSWQRALSWTQSNGSATYKLCDLGQVKFPVKGRGEVSISYLWLHNK